MSSTEFRAVTNERKSDETSRAIDERLTFFDRPRSGGAIGLVRPIRFNELEDRLGYTFKDRGNLTLALTPRQLAYGGKLYHQRLEWLGDAALEVAISGVFLRQFSIDRQGVLFGLGGRLRSNHELRDWGAAVEIKKFLNFSVKSKGDVISDSVVGDVMEAIFGAMYVDGGLEPIINALQGRLSHRGMPAILSKKNRDHDSRSSAKLRLKRYRGESKASVEVSIDDFARSKRSQSRKSEVDSTPARRAQRMIGWSVLRLATTEEFLERSPKLALDAISNDRDRHLSVEHLGRRIDASEDRLGILRGGRYFGASGNDIRLTSFIRKRLVGELFAEAGYETARAVSRVFLGFDERQPRYLR